MKTTYYEAVPVEKELPEISTINICILENGSSLQMHYGYGGWNEAGHYNKTWMGSPIKFWLREVSTLPQEEPGKVSEEETHCPTCGSLVIVAGDDKEGTHYYVPVQPLLAVTVSEILEMIDDMISKEEQHHTINALYNLRSRITGKTETK